MSGKGLSEAIDVLDAAGALQGRGDAVRSIIKAFSDFRSHVQDEALSLDNGDRERAHAMITAAAIFAKEFEDSL